jgi:transcriptional regulator with XRE-family HTH domain
MNNILSDMAPNPSSERESAASFSVLLKRYRKRQGRSQLETSLEANVSQRHLSFLESGRSKPSREMILSLSEALELPLRERNRLLASSGFISLYKERSLDHSEMKAINDALALSLFHHEPYPAIVVDRNWNMIMCNDSTTRFLGLLGDPEKIWQKVGCRSNKNIYRLTFHSSGMKPLISNWLDLAKTLLSRLHREANADPENNELNILLKDMIQASGIDMSAHTSEEPHSLAPIIPMEITLGNMTLKMVSMISSFGTAQDITTEELKVETFYPMDDITISFFKRMAELKG